MKSAISIDALKIDAAETLHIVVWSVEKIELKMIWGKGCHISMEIENGSSLVTTIDGEQLKECNSRDYYNILVFNKDRNQTFEALIWLRRDGQEQKLIYNPLGGYEWYMPQRPQVIHGNFGTYFRIVVGVGALFIVLLPAVPIYIMRLRISDSAAIDSPPGPIRIGKWEI
uniref:Glycosyl transferase n=3 Tax=Bursaphelenchus xylophilus TaxID=6326 RepID=A0A1I7SGW9_BURXY